MTGESLNIVQDQLEKLKQLFPEAITEGKIDWEKLQATLGKENIEFRNERYVLNWAGKADAFKVLQQSTTATLKPCPGEGINDGFDSLSFGEGRGEVSENVFIEGENLEVLKVLQKAYYGKIKCIIIDPPYNTGSDSFIYPDSFKESKEGYQKRIGDIDEEGYLLKEGMFRKNSKDSGHYHSNWLSMMYPRLFLAKNLLRDDGVIFVHIDDNEVHNLRLIMNEIFGEENTTDRGAMVWLNKGSTKGFTKIVKNHEYILSYSKNVELVKSLFGENFSDSLDIIDERLQIKRSPRNPLARVKFPKGLRMEGINNIIFDKSVGNGSNLIDIIEGPLIFENGLLKEDVVLEASFPYKNQMIDFFSKIGTGKETFDTKGQKWIEVYFRKSGVPYFKKTRNTLVISSVLDDVSNSGFTDLKDLELHSYFDNPKPVNLIKKLLSFFSSADDIILDFFAGSGTTAQAVLELNKEDGGNRKFILVQLPEKCDEESEAYKAGYKTIADISKERIRRVIKNLTPYSPLQMERGRGNSTENLFKGANPSLFEKAHQLRLVDTTKAEEILWEVLRNRKVENCKFRRQHPIGQFIADIYCHEKKLVIEVDGGYHNEPEQKEYDEARTQVINEYGITVIRFTNDEVLNNLQSVKDKITNALKTQSEGALLSKWRGAGGEVGFKVFKLSSSNFKIWRGNEITEENLETQLDAFTNPVRERSEKENMLYELILKAGYLLTDKVSPLERGLRGVYSIANGELIIALENPDNIGAGMNQELINKIISAKPKKVITLDKLFIGNDQLKTNTVLQMRDAEIDFKTI